ncbi:hypothetical protein MLD38_021309 [Melastoma candidum]|uniref:Uncharacterized protein n=1 Tax=Melastoma candidum TaxID=119954 RepID=A0ACB9QG86_9MYRT|nr:hypothetical protein MLD38_021309 [Melastoma candidum]
MKKRTSSQVEDSEGSSTEEQHFKRKRRPEPALESDVEDVPPTPCIPPNSDESSSSMDENDDHPTSTPIAIDKLDLDL